MSTDRRDWMRAPAELIEPGDLVMRNLGDPHGVVRFCRPGETRVTIDVLVNRGAGLELETWRPRPATDIWLRHRPVGVTQAEVDAVLRSAGDGIDPAVETFGAGVRAARAPVGATVRPGQCEYVGDTSAGLRRCVQAAGHDGRHICVGVVS